MKKEVLYKKLFNLTSIITDHFPKAGARILDFLLLNILGNKILFKFFSLQAERRVKKVKTFNCFLLVSDMNIGDAINCSSGVAAVRKIFPDAEIDYVVKKSTKNLFKGNSDISNLFPVFIGSPFPTDDDLLTLKRLAQNKAYDLIINFSPMIDNKIFGNRNVVDFSLIAVELLRNAKDKQSINNVSFQTYRFITILFKDLLPEGFNNRFNGPGIYLSDDAIEKADNFLSDHGISNEVPIVMFNPDTSSKYTRIPFVVQLELLKKIAGLECIIFISEGRIEKNIEKKLIQYLQPEVREKIIIVNAGFNLEEYAALTDLSDIFITGDSGPLHLAAARKYSRSGQYSLRNKTAIFSIFGSTPERVYGLDSKAPGFFAANQDAPSRVFVGKSPCRNISCINKLAKTCSQVRCFQQLDSDEIILEAANHLATTQKYKSLRRNRYLLNNISSSCIKKTDE
jgi:ADP-heptose:LPS heptosyltransferase